MVESECESSLALAKVLTENDLCKRAKGYERIPPLSFKAAAGWSLKENLKTLGSDPKG